MNTDLIIPTVQTVIAAALFFVWVVRYDNIIKEFKHDYKYPNWLRDLTGILKLSCAAMLLNTNPELQSVGLKGLVLLMVFAVATHIRVKSGLKKVLPSLVLLLLCLFLMFYGQTNH